MDKKPDAGTKKRFFGKVAPSKAPARVLKKQLRSMERLLKNKDNMKDLPEEVVAETEKKIADIKSKIEALGPQAEPSTSAQKKNNKASRGGIRATELRRAGRKIVAFKKQHPNYMNSETESKEFDELELDLMYLKVFPKTQEFIPIYAESVDESQAAARAEIRENIRKGIESGEIKKSMGVDKSKEQATSASENLPESNWDSDEESDDDSEADEEEDERKAKKQKKE
ncbi:hypothetical protein FBU30_009097 [Linnemannia zychae]|nr:hypothetical protein FBU30_009097 [Linnemannia zychae]